MYYAPPRNRVRTTAFLIAAAVSFGWTSTQAEEPTTTCVDVQVGTARSYACLNQRLQALSRATAANAHLPDAPYDARSPGNVTGQFNESATRNRLGANFGKSVTPERPGATYPHRS